MKTCIVCEARLSRKRFYQCPNSDTCDPICTRAKRAGRTRIEQYFADDEEDKQLEKLGFPPIYHRSTLAE